MQVITRSLENGEFKSYTVEWQETVFNLKKKIQKNENIPNTDCIILYYKTQILDRSKDEMILRQLQIVDKSLIDLQINRGRHYDNNHNEVNTKVHLNNSNEIRLCIYCNDKVNHLTIRQDETLGDLKQKIRSKGFQNHNINYGTKSLHELSDSTSIID